MSQLLSQNEIHEIHNVVVNLGLERVSLLQGLPRSYEASLPRATTLSAQYLLDLNNMNRVPRLNDGSCPLEIWLNNAKLLANPLPQEAVLETFLEMVRAKINRPLNPDVADVEERVHFLDALPLDWTRPETNELLSLLVSAYPRSKQLEFVVERAGLPLGDIPQGSTAREQWRSTLMVLRKAELLRALLEEASQDDSVAAFRGRFQDMLGGKPRVTTQVGSERRGPTHRPSWVKEAKSELIHERLLANRRAILPIATAQGIVQRSESVAKLYLSFQDVEAFGTGFLISPTLLLTNHHNVKHVTYGDAEHIVAVFGPEKEDTVRCSRVSARSGAGTQWVENPELDWAILELEHPSKLKPLSLGTRFPIKQGDMVVIIQHPGGGDKQFSMEHEAIHRKRDPYLQYLADTEQGSSGSPVFNERLEVIALHHASFSEVVSMGDDKYTIAYNQGVLIDAILDDLQRFNITLRP